MEFMSIVDAKARAPSGCAVVGIYENGDLGIAARHIDKQLSGTITSLHGSGDFSAKVGDTLMLPLPSGSTAARLLLVGLGGRAAFGRKQYRKALLACAQALAKTGADDAIVYLAMETVPELDVQYRARMVAEVFSSQAYKIPDLKTSPKPKARRLTKVQVATADARGAKATTEGLQAGTALAGGLAFARDLANLPPNVCTPTYMGTRAQALAKEFPSIKTKIVDEAGIKALKMGAFLAVTQGSAQPPRLIVCEYRGSRKNTAPICLIGKGITFDSGGISLKDPPAMDEMKFDMSGGATVLGALRAVAAMKLPINVVAIVAAAENMPSGTAVTCPPRSSSTPVAVPIRSAGPDSGTPVPVSTAGAAPGADSRSAFSVPAGRWSGAWDAQPPPSCMPMPNVFVKRRFARTRTVRGSRTPGETFALTLGKHDALRDSGALTNGNRSSAAGRTSSRSRKTLIPNRPALGNSQGVFLWNTLRRISGQNSFSSLERPS